MMPKYVLTVGAEPRVANLKTKKDTKAKQIVAKLKTKK